MWRCTPDQMFGGGGGGGRGGQVKNDVLTICFCEVSEILTSLFICEVQVHTRS